MSSRPPLRLATRGSALALAQSRHVQALLSRTLGGDREVELIVVSSLGDRDQSRFTDLPAVGVFVKELEEALLEGRADLAVHSLKDLPTVQPPGLVIAAVLEREDARDALITRSGLPLADLPAGAVIGTSSPRRKAQLRRTRPDLAFVEVRGNVDTRIARLRRGEFDALVLALAGLKRLGRSSDAGEILTFDLMLPAPGQGAVAIECRADCETAAIVARLDHPASRIAVEAERRLLFTLGGGCSVPLGAIGRQTGDELELLARVCHPDTGESLEGRRSGPVQEGVAMADSLARELLDAGARRLLDPTSQPIPLRGRRVVLTRAAVEDDQLAHELQTLGAEVLSCPAIEIAAPADPAPLAEAARTVAEFAWLVFTSGNAVTAFAAALTGVGLAPASAKRVAVIGSATARAAVDQGFEVELVAPQATGAGLGRALEGRIAVGDRVLFPRARDAGRALPQALISAGALVVEVEAYATRSPATLTESVGTLLADGSVDVITFASPSAVRNFLAVLPEPGRSALFHGAVIACIGPTTAAAARDRGLVVDLVAPVATAESFAATLASHLGR